MAKITFAHAGDHAVVALTGELDWDASREFVEVIDTLVEDYFYAEVELLVTSPGGNVLAFEFCLAQQEEWRRQGVTLRTRILSQAASAAAVLVSLGDERVAAPGATLSYHCAHFSPESGVNAQATATLSSLLREVDDRMVARLAARVLASDGEVAHGAERADRKLLEHLWTAFGRTGRGGKAPRKIKGLARAVGRYVDRAVRRRNADALGLLYRRLFEFECTISAPLALTLRLIDRIGARTPRDLCMPGTPGLTIPEWRGLYPPSGEVAREVLTRHTLVLGETGSGKTASAVLPILAAMVRAPCEALASALVIDPKRELGPVLTALAPERVHHLRAETAVFDVMSGPRWSLEADLAGKRWVSAAQRILRRVASCVPGSPARVLVAHEATNDVAEFFNREGTALAESVVAFILLVLDPDAPPPEQWLARDPHARGWVDDLVQRAWGEPGTRGPNLLALASWALEGVLMSPPEPRGNVAVSGHEAPDPGGGWLFARLASCALDHGWLGVGEGRDLCERVRAYWASMIVADRQWAGVRATASIVCSDFASAAIARSLYFGCEPGHLEAWERTERVDFVDFAELVARDGPGTLVLFQPTRDELDRLLAVAMKALFFEAVLANEDRAEGGADVPLVGYVADEFHRFVTSDPLHGEQSFLDTCRSFSAFCVLACQSVASIEHALSHGSGNSRQDESATAVLWTNTASKLVFRSTDARTSNRLGELCPSRPGLAGVVQVRPLSTLQPGECYAVLADGRVERRQLKAFVPPEKAPARSVALLEGPDREGGRG